MKKKAVRREFYSPKRAEEVRTNNNECFSKADELMTYIGSMPTDVGKQKIIELTDFIARNEICVDTLKGIKIIVDKVSKKYPTESRDLSSKITDKLENPSKPIPKILSETTTPFTFKENEDI